jgi:hypothetical protein
MLVPVVLVPIPGHGSFFASKHSHQATCVFCYCRGMVLILLHSWRVSCAVVCAVAFVLLLLLLIEVEDRHEHVEFLGLFCCFNDGTRFVKGKANELIGERE